MKQNAKTYMKPLIEVVPLKEPLMQEILPGTNVTYESWGKENGFDDKEDIGKYFFFNDPWE